MEPKNVHAELKIVDALLDKVNVEIKKQSVDVKGHRWTFLGNAKKRNDLGDKVKLIKATEQILIDKIDKIFAKENNLLSNDEMIKIYNKIDNFMTKMEKINQSANQHNNKLYIRFLSLFSNKFKVDTLNTEYKRLDNKIFSLVYQNEVLKDIYKNT
jgi:hypothetical protein